MKIIREIFARIWALYSLASFMMTMFVVLLPICITYLIPEPKGTAIFRKISNLWMHTWLTMVGCPITIKGKENFKKGETYIVTCNHNSLLDIPLTTPFIPGPNKTIAKKTFTRVPFFGWIYARGSVLVNRKHDESRRKSYDDMKKAIQQGIHMCIYPEGTRNRTNQPLKSFYDGAFKLSVDTKKNIIPAIIFNTKKALPVNRLFYFIPQKLELHFLESISPDGLTHTQLKEKVHQTMSNYILQQA